MGPGPGTLHRELRRRVRGPVDFVEPSRAFARALERRGARDGLGRGLAWPCPLSGADLPRGAYDLVFARWVFLFLPEPLAHLRKLARALKPGGLLAVEDYQRDTLALIPRPPHWEEFMAADRAFFASRGGEANAGAVLPGLCREAGLEVREVVPEVKWGRPGSAVWAWLSAYFLGVMGRYAAFPPFSAAKARAVSRAWRAAAGEKTALIIAPTVLGIVAAKPRKRP